MWSRILVAPAAIVLALYAAAALAEVPRLAFTGAWVMYGTAAVLLAFAAGLALRQLWGWLFAVGFFALTALAYGALAATLAHEAFTTSGGGDWAGVRTLLVGLMAGVAAVAAAGSGYVLVPLSVSLRGVEGRRAVDWTVAAVVALTGLGAVGWMVGHRYVFGRLRAQNDCLGGRVPACQQLARDERLTAGERRLFARSACAAGDATGCRLVAGFLGARGPSDGEERALLERRCRAGDGDLCQRAAAALLRTGDRNTARELLAGACARDVRYCHTAARVALEAGDAETTDRLLDEGCARGAAASCREKLRRWPSSLANAEWRALVRRTCLLGDVNDCRPLMREDLRGICDEVCAGETEARQHTCVACAREARETGDRARAETWLAASCGRGHAWACRERESAPGVTR